MASTFLLQCSKCGAKITAAGTTVGGETGCTHAFGPITPQQPKRQKIVYPSDAERNWLLIIDQNKDENSVHYNKFQEAVEKLNKNKQIGMAEISSMIQTLQTKLDEREKQLQEQLANAFEERQTKIYQNMKALQEHKSKNEETKDNAEELLLSDISLKEREKQIVSSCENVINMTPQIRYVDTQMEYKFRSLQKIENEIDNFGQLLIKQIDGGNPCTFKSCADSANAPSGRPKTIDLDKVFELVLKSSTFDPKQKKVKISFKFSKKEKEPLLKYDDALKNLQIHVFCAEDNDDQKDEDEIVPIYEETVTFNKQNCKPVKNKFELYVNHKFQPGLTIGFKLRAKFKSPDEKKLSNAVGSWSREQTYEIPEEEDDTVTFKISLNDSVKTLTLKEDDVALQNFGQFITKFLSEFGAQLRDNQQLVLSTDDGVVHAQTDLSKYASDSYTINGQIITEPPPMAYQPPPQQQQSPPPKVEAPGVVERPKVEEKHIPKQISTIVVLNANGDETKKRVVLKNNPKKSIYEYTMDALKAKVAKKLKGKGLKAQYSLQTADGQRIEEDRDIIDFLIGYEGEIQVVQ